MSDNLVIVESPAKALHDKPEDVLAVMLAGYLGVLCYAAATAAPKPPENQALANWLVAHGLTHGVAGYWQADSVSFDSGERVTIVPVFPDSVMSYYWDSKASWFDSSQNYANFLIMENPSAGLYLFFGRPARVYHYGQFTIMVWHENLVPLLTQGYT